METKIMTVVESVRTILPNGIKLHRYRYSWDTGSGFIASYTTKNYSKVRVTARNENCTIVFTPA